MKIVRHPNETLKDRAEREGVVAQSVQNAADIEYLAAMSDIPLEDDSTGSMEEVTTDDGI